MKEQDFKTKQYNHHPLYSKLESSDKVKMGFYDLYNKQSYLCLQGEYINNEKLQNGLIITMTNK